MVGFLGILNEKIFVIEQFSSYLLQWYPKYIDHQFHFQDEIEEVNEGLESQLLPFLTLVLLKQHNSLVSLESTRIENM